MSIASKARAVIIGGGVSGCSVAYHLAKLGWTDVVLLERKQLTSGTTWHAAGLIGQLRGSQNMTRLAKYSADLYVKLEAETGVAHRHAPGRLDHRGADRGAQAGDLPAGLAGARLRRRRARDLARRGQGDVSASQRRRTSSAPCTCRSTASAIPANIAMALAKGARQRGARIVEGVKVTAVTPEGRPRHRRRLGAGTASRARSRPTSSSTAPACGRASSARRTASPCRCMPASISTSSPSRSPASTRLPVLRVPDECAYYKEDAGKMLLGAFEPVAKPWGMDGIREDFCFDQLPEDLDHFEPILEMGVNRMPMLATAGIHTFFNGPESFTPDDRYYLGEAPELRGYWVAAGFNSIGIVSSGGAGMALAQWIDDGEPPFDLWEVDIRRAQPFQKNRALSQGARHRDARPALCRPFPLPADGDARAACAARRCTSSSRRAARCSARSRAGSAPTGSRETARSANTATPGSGRTGSTTSARSIWRCANGVGLFDMTSFGKIRVEGRDALRLPAAALRQRHRRGAGPHRLHADAQRSAAASRAT